MIELAELQEKENLIMLKGTCLSKLMNFANDFVRNQTFIFGISPLPSKL